MRSAIGRSLFGVLSGNGRVSGKGWREYTEPIFSGGDAGTVGSFFVYTGRRGIWPPKRPRPGTAGRGKGFPCWIIKGGTIMAHYRETVCAYYVAAGQCRKGRQASHQHYCQKCDKYMPRARVRHMNQKKKKLEGIRKREMREE